MKDLERKALRLLVCAMVVGVPAMKATAQADVALCLIQSTTRWGTSAGITAYSLGTMSVNVGTTNLNWIGGNNNHPVIGQTMFKLENGRFEQIGQSWLKHGFCALQHNSTCDSGCPGQGGCLNFLAPGCQDPYTSQRNGTQTLLGPKWQVNADTGVYPYPAANGDQGNTGNVTYMRLQVHNTDLGHADAIYFVEGQYVAKDDAAAENQDNNASYRMVSIGAGPTFSIGFVAGQFTEFQRPAIMAWGKHGNGINMVDLDVTLTKVEVPDEGLFWVSYKASDNGDGTWHYEYAVQNVNSHRSARLFSIPIGADVTITNVGFHDVDYHSGDGGPGFVNYDGTDWAAPPCAASITWSTQTEAQNTLANALRWGTLYNFRFDANSPPQDVVGTLGLYRSGDPTSMSFDTQGPSDLCPGNINGDGLVGIVDLLALLAAWGPNLCHPADINGDGLVGIVDLLILLAHWGPCP